MREAQSNLNANGIAARRARARGARIADEVIMPMLGMAQETGKVVRWLKAEGEPSAKAEPLMEVETDKVTVEIEAPAAGTLAGVAAPRATTSRRPGDRLRSSATASSSPEPERGRPSAAHGARAPGNGHVPGQPGTAAWGRPAAAARRDARVAEGAPAGRERGVPIEEIAGSGPVRRGAGGRRPGSGAPPRARRHRTHAAATSSVVAWRRWRADVARRGSEVPHFYLSREVDATRLNAWRDASAQRAGYER
jgi:pyruvate dehydrogenase E2 component (dihydrolipoamide acetyltransferase)